MPLSQILLTSDFVFPSSVKLSQHLGNVVIFPIPKRGDPTDPNNHHSIPLISGISKVFEAAIPNQLRLLLERKGLLSEPQSSF